MADVKKTKEPLLHIAKRDDITGMKAWLIRIAAIVIGLLLSGVLSALLTGASFFEVYEIMFTGVFGKIFQGKTTMLWRFLQQTAILLCLALGVTPAFKMRFWNCGESGCRRAVGSDSRTVPCSVPYQRNPVHPDDELRSHANRCLLCGFGDSRRWF